MTERMPTCTAHCQGYGMRATQHAPECPVGQALAELRAWLERTDAGTQEMQHLATLARAIHPSGRHFSRWMNAEARVAAVRAELEEARAQAQQELERLRTRLARVGIHEPEAE